MRVLSNAELTQRLEKLEQSFFASRNREVSNTYTSEDALNKADSLTPTVLSKKVSIGDTEVTFNDVPSGNITVFVEDENGNYPNYTMERNSNIITVYFEPSEYVITVILSIV